MDKDLLLLVGSIEKWAVGLTAAFSLAGWVIGGGAVGAGVAVGGVVVLVNFKGLRFFTCRVALAAERRWAKVLTHVSIGVRYLALSGVFWVLIQHRWVDLTGLLVGLSVVSLAVTVAGVRHGLQASRPERVP